MTNAKPRIALTSGEPAGIGPELCVRVAREPCHAELVVIGDRDLLAGAARIEHVPLARRVTPGKLEEEILVKNNMAAAIMTGAFILGVCIIIARVVGG